MAMETAEAFEPWIGQVFVTANGQYALELARVERLAAAGLSGRQPFTLIFRGPPKQVLPGVLPEGHHRFELAGGQAISFHIMPIHTPAPGRQDYQAVFN